MNSLFDQSRTVRRSGRTVRRSALIAALFGLLTFGCSRDDSLGTNSQSLQQSDRPPTPEVIPVSVVTAEAIEVRRTTSQPATVHPYFAAEIRAQAHGYVTRVAGDIGDRVEKGAVLAEIDVPELQASLTTQSAQVELLKAGEQQAAAGARQAAAGITQAEAALAEAQSRQQEAAAMFAAAEAERNRVQDLVQRGSLQPRNLDEATKKRDAAAAGLEVVRSGINSAEAGVTAAQSSAASAEAELAAALAATKVAEAKLQELQAAIAFRQVRAPFSGIITGRYVAPGDLVGNAAAGPLFHIMQTDRVRVHVVLPESAAATVRVGDPIELRFPALPNSEPLQAAVTRVTGNIDPQTRTMPAEAELDNSDGRLLPGMYGSAVVTLSGASTAAASLPAAAVRFDKEGAPFVYRIENGVVRVTSVETGFDDGNRIGILSGLEVGHQVIDAHLSRFTDGQAVQILN